jgi:FHA domain
MGLRARIGLAVLAAAGAWVISWLVLVLIGDENDASWVIGIVVASVLVLVGFWVVSGSAGSGVAGSPAAQRAGGALGTDAGQEAGTAPDTADSPAAYLSLLGKRGPKTLSWIRPGEHLIGRHPASCDIQVPDIPKFWKVGKVHARLISDGPTTWVQGLHNNETFVNDELISRPGRRQLRDFDEISLGGRRGVRGVCVFRFTLRPQQVKVASTAPSMDGEATTILMVTADPGKAGWQRLDSELEAIDRAVRGSHLTVEAASATSLSGLQAEILRQERSILHFAGQAGGGAGVPLTAEDFGTALVTADELGRFFQASAPLVRCVVMSSCYEPQQGLAVAEHVPCVVGTSPDLQGDAAVAFSRAFYEALVAERPVVVAFKAARRAAGMYLGHGDLALPVLHVRPGAERTSFAS